MPSALSNAPPQLFDLILTCSQVSISIALPPRPTYSSKPSIILCEFGSLLSPAATTPNEFVLNGDSNIHVDNPSDPLASDFLNLLSSVNLTQHVHFPTHVKNHTLDLLITSAASLLSPKLSHSVLNITDHYLIMADLDINPFPRPPPATPPSYRVH